MTVPAEVSELSFTGDAANDTFPVSFPIQQKADLVVTLLLAGATVPVLQVLGTHYDVVAQGPTATPFDSSNVVMVTPPPAFATLTAARTVPITQEKSLRVAGIFDAKTHENALDKLTYIAQQLERRLLAVEALGNLVPVGDFSALMFTIHFITHATSIQDTWPRAVVTPANFVVTGLTKVKQENVTDPTAVFREAVDLDWSWSDRILLLKNVSGLQPDTEYRITVLLFAIGVPFGDVEALS